MIKNIVFDMGNVLVRYDPQYYLRNYSAEDAEVLKREIYQSPDWLALDRGELTETELIDRVRSRLPENLAEEAKKLIPWYRITTKVDGMEELIQDLHKQGYPIYLLSNTSLAFHQFREDIAALRYFTGEFISADCGLLKPDERIYHLFCRQFSLRPEECLFIDDSAANIESAVRVGFHGIVFDGNTNHLRNQLTAMGIPANPELPNTRPLIKNIDWKNDAESITVTKTASYPRLFQLRDGTLLCGIDGFCFRSSDQGKTWSAGYDYRQNYRKTGADGKEYTLSCANSAFFELDDGTLLAGYRATGWLAEDKSLFCTKLLVSQSRDGGKTWTAHSVMCEYYDEEGQFKGVWEPHFGLIGGVLTCFYANDSRSVIAPPYQNIESLRWIDGQWTDRTIIANGTENKSRDGMPVWQRLENGSYVCVIEGWYPGTMELCIELMHSPDGITWSRPQVIYRSPHGGVGAPYVVELPTGQLLVTFQDPYRHCLGILSDGTPAEKLTPEHFSEPVNIFGTEGNHYSMWNAQYLTENYLYAVTGTDSSPCGSGTVIKRIAVKDLLSR